MQLAFGRTTRDAKARFAAKTRACRGLLGDEVPDCIAVQNRVSGRKGFVMARIGRSSRDKALTLCQRLSAQGCPCRVYRN